MAAGCFPPRRLSVIGVASRCQLCRRVSAVASPMCCRGDLGSQAPPSFLQRRQPAEQLVVRMVCAKRCCLIGAVRLVVQPWPRRRHPGAGAAYRRQCLPHAHSCHGAVRWQQFQADSNRRGAPGFGGRCAAVLRLPRAACGKLSTKTSADQKAARQQHARQKPQWHGRCSTYKLEAMPENA